MDKIDEIKLIPERIIHLCEEEGCDEKAFLYSLEGEDGKSIEYYRYCPSHCYDNGYCWGCGRFCGGIEEFDFNNPTGLCETCLEQLKCEMGEYDDQDNEFEYDPDVSDDDGYDWSDWKNSIEG